MSESLEEDDGVNALLGFRLNPESDAVEISASWREGAGAKTLAALTFNLIYGNIYEQIEESILDICAEDGDMTDYNIFSEAFASLVAKNRKNLDVDEVVVSPLI